MSANTKIVVLRMKELIYTGIFAALGILILLLLLFLLLHGNEKETGSAASPSDSVQESSAQESSTQESSAQESSAQESSAQESSAQESVLQESVQSDSFLKNTEVLSTTLYIPGIYTTQLVLGDQNVEIEVIVDQTSITSLKINHISDETASMYPLLQSPFDTICEQIYAQQSLDNITYESHNKYTSMVLVEAIRSSLDKAYAN